MEVAMGQEMEAERPPPPYSWDTPDRQEKNLVIDGIPIEMSPQKSITGDYFGGATFNPSMAMVPFASPGESSVRDVAAFGPAGGYAKKSSFAPKPQTMVTGHTPALLALQQAAKVPYFDGDDRHWVEFARDWVKYSAYALIGAPDGPMGNVLKRDILINCLHGVLRKRYEARILAQPNLTFEEVWKDLEDHYQVDDPHRWRREWGQVYLAQRGEEIKLKDLLFFESAFETAKSMVSDWTKQEELDLLLRQIPTGWRRKVLKAEAKAAESKHVLKVSNCPVDAQKLQLILQKVGVHVIEIVSLAGCMHVRVATAGDQERVQKLDLQIAGKKLVVIPIRERWMATKIFKWLANELKIEQETLVLSRGTDGSKELKDTEKGSERGRTQNREFGAKVSEIKKEEQGSKPNLQKKSSGPKSSARKPSEQASPKEGSKMARYVGLVRRQAVQPIILLRLATGPRKRFGNV